jgi:pimeloyl-ACP methyl ester carboxylesterase
MNTFLHRSRLALLAVLLFPGCAQYSSVTEKRPKYQPLTPVGALLVKALDGDQRKPLVLLGAYLDAAAQAERELHERPGDVQARKDYNFAVGRVFEVIHDADLHPWDAPIAVPGAEGTWDFAFKADKRPEANPALYHLLPADRYAFHGSYVGQRSVKEGLGAPIVVSGREGSDFTKLDRFAQGKRIYYGVTAFITFEGRRCVVSYADPLSVETVRFAGHTFPLAADYTAPLGLALARENPKKLEIARVLRPGKYAETARLARLQPYDPQKIPVLCVHGLMDSPATWMPIINTLRADPGIRAKYQFWFYSYPSGYPYPYSAAILREQLDAIKARYPGHKKIVLLGHSMGSMISRLMITDSGDKLWMNTFGKPPAEVSLSAETRQKLEQALIFRHRPEVSRVIFIAGPHRGSLLATNWIGRLASSLVKSPLTLLKVGDEMRKVVTAQVGALKLDRIPNSVDTLAPTNRFVLAINTIPITPGIPYHSIMGDRGKGGNKDRTPPVSGDGIVPYWSSHLDGAQSELIVPSGHSAHQNPQAIEEVRRILRLHAGLSGQN